MGRATRSGPVVRSEAGTAGLRARAEQARAEAARVRGTGTLLGRGLWAVAGLALVFTMANVTRFATDHGTPVWIAVLLDPMASVALMVVLIGESVLSRHGVRAGGWSAVLKLAAAASTWAMNVWSAAMAQDVAGVVLHSVPPALVILLAEVTPVYRVKFADLATRLEAEAADQVARADALAAEARATAAGADRSVPTEPARSSGPVDGPAGGPFPAVARPGPVARSGGPAGGPVVRLADRSDRRATAARSGGPAAAGLAREQDRTTALLPAAREIAAAHLAEHGRPIARRPLAAALRQAGQSCSNDVAAALLERLGETNETTGPEAGEHVG